MVMAAPEAELEDEAAGRQHVSKASVPAYSDLKALPPALFLFRSLQRQPPKETDPRSSRSWPLPDKFRRRSGQVQMLLLPHPPRHGVPGA